MLYLVYVLSNRTIEKFYHEDIESPVSSLDPSVPDFEPHTHRDSRDSRITPINDGCGELCESGGWTRPIIPFNYGALVTTSITNNTLTISHITLNKSINHPFYDLWYIEIGILPQGETWKDISININGNTITKTRSQANEYNLSDVFSTDGILKGEINIDLSIADVTGNFRIYLGILDENYRNPTLESLDNQDHVWNRFTFYRHINYTPCAVVGGECTLGNDCCGDMVCSGRTCQPNCPVNYYDDDNGVCVLCPTYSAHPPTGCSNCLAGKQRDIASVSDSASVNGCVDCPYGTYRSANMEECEHCPGLQQPNEYSGAINCEDCPLGKVRSNSDDAYCNQHCPAGTQAPSAGVVSDCTTLCSDFSNKVRAANSPAGCVECPPGSQPNVHFIASVCEQVATPVTIPVATPVCTDGLCQNKNSTDECCPGRYCHERCVREGNRDNCQEYEKSCRNYLLRADSCGRLSSSIQCEPGTSCSGRGNPTCR